MLILLLLFQIIFYTYISIYLFNINVNKSILLFIWAIGITIFFLSSGILKNVIIIIFFGKSGIFYLKRAFVCPNTHHLSNLTNTLHTSPYFRTIYAKLKILLINPDI